MHLSDNDAHAVVILWEWESETAQPSSTPIDSDKEESESDQDESEHTSELDDDPECHQDTESNTTAECIHTITFKCIGSTREKKYQVLEKARDRIQEGFTVPVCLTPEPYNMYDSEAVAYECNLDGEWKKVGYVVREVLPEVHAALQEKKITGIIFSWIKWNTAWPQSGQDYAGIDISKKCYWGATVVSSRSTR